jgi:hypothetical protein
MRNRLWGSSDRETPVAFECSGATGGSAVDLKRGCSIVGWPEGLNLFQTLCYAQDHLSAACVAGVRKSCSFWGDVHNGSNHLRPFERRRAPGANG